MWTKQVCSPSRMSKRVKKKRRKVLETSLVFHLFICTRGKQAFSIFCAMKCQGGDQVSTIFSFGWSGAYWVISRDFTLHFVDLCSVSCIRPTWLFQFICRILRAHLEGCRRSPNWLTAHLSRLLRSGFIFAASPQWIRIPGTVLEYYR